MKALPHPYFDSGILIKLYIRERNSADAIKLITPFSCLPFNRLHELEITNTFHTLAGRGLITVVQRVTAEHHLASDLASGRLSRQEPDWLHLFQDALDLARQFSTTALARSLDILHVATAIAVKADIFITADKRQYDLAMQTGLECQYLT